MHLLDLFGKDEQQDLGLRLKNIRFEKVVDDSRLVEKGDVMVLDVRELTHVKASVADIAEQAIARGASYIITNAEEKSLSELDSTFMIYVPNPALCLMRYAKILYPQAPQYVAGVTGTNGKTSTASFFEQICAQAGFKSASVGTLGVKISDGEWVSTGFTTPKAVRLHQILHELAQSGVSHVCIEVSSHALALNRADGVDFAAAAFTNISPDHTDFHGSMDAYFVAKSRLFTELLQTGKTAVLNMLNPVCWPLAAVCKEREVQVLSAGPSNAELILRAEKLEATSMEIEVKYKKFAEKFTLPLSGAFQVENLSAAVGLALSCGVAIEDILLALPRLKGVAGRMESVTPAGHPFSVVVDYAHTPDALEKALAALVGQVQNRLIVVFGCGGDRDKTKRPLMGAIAQKIANVVIITDDNPRTENAEEIRSQIAKAAPNALNCPDRAGAIKMAIDMAEAGDVILLAGKGHENGQIIGKEVLPFDDRKVAISFLSAS